VFDLERCQGFWNLFSLGGIIPAECIAGRAIPFDLSDQLTTVHGTLMDFFEKRLT
jgi:hypothetical protein